MDKYVIRKRPSDQAEAGEGGKKPAGIGHNTVSEEHSNDFYTEKKGDLFSCGVGESLAHCISVDCHMGKGIAALFKSKFGGIQELKEQEPKVGGVAVLQRDGRYIYYLITKERYFHKPTYDSLRASLEAMKEHCMDNNVSAISMPKIGCGLDRLQWPKVSAMLKELFEDTGIKITVYYI